LTFSRAPVASALLAVAAVGLSGLLSTPAAAVGLTGASMGVGYYFPDDSTLYFDATATPSSFVVGAGQEADIFVEGATHVLVDFDNDSLTIVLQTTLSSPTWRVASFNGPIFTSALPHGISRATVDGSTTLSGFDATRVSLTSDQIRLNWDGLFYRDGTIVKVDFSFVPEPGTLPLVASSVVALVALGRAKRG
jgi:hypothetical protein